MVTEFARRVGRLLHHVAEDGMHEIDLVNEGVAALAWGRHTAHVIVVLVLVLNREGALLLR